MTDITLTASIRSNLLSLQNTTKLLDTTSERLSTGKRVNSALDNPNSFFTARGLSNRAGDLSARKDSIGQSISLLQATDKSINSITSLVEQAKAVAQQAEEAATSGVATIATQAAALSGVTVVSTEAAAAAVTGITTISSATAAAAANAGVTALSSATINTASGTNNLVHSADGAAGTSAGSALTAIFTNVNVSETFTVIVEGQTLSTFTSATTANELINAINASDVGARGDISASFDTDQFALEIVGEGGASITFTSADTIIADMGMQDIQGALTSGTASNFATAGDSTDLLTAAFTNLAAADEITFNVTGGSGSNDAVAFTVEGKTVDDLVSYISNTDADVTASFNTTTNQIDITSSNGGEQIIFSGAGGLTELAFTDGTTTISDGSTDTLTFASTQAATDTLVSAFSATATDVLSLVYNSTTTNFTVDNKTIADLVSSISGVDADITASFNTGTNQIDITSGVGGAGLTFIDTAGAPLTELALNNGTGLVADGAAETFTSFANGSDLVTTAYGAAATDVLTVALTNGGSANVTIGTQTIDELVTAIAAVDSGITASFNTSTTKIDISTATGNEITFTNQTGTPISSLTLDGTFTSVTSGTGVTFTDTTAAVTSGDLLTAVFSGVSNNDAFTIATSSGGTTTFTVGTTSTIADLVTAIGESDSALTASYNTSTQTIDVTATTGTAVTFTNTVGTAIASLGLTDGNNSLTSGTAVTYGSSGSATEVASLNSDFQSILEQIDTLLDDASYKGTNLLKGSNDFVVKFNADGSSSLTLTGLDLGVTGNTDLKFTLDADGYDFTGTGITTALADTANAIDHLRSVASTFGTGLGIIQTREEFTSELVSVLQSGADKLVNANLEEESANLLALQTRQALGIQSLSIANQSQQSVLSLFR